MESVLLSISASHISILESKKYKSGKLWSNLKKDDSVRPLTAILTLNTIAHTVGALGVGVEVEKLNPGEYGMAIASAVLTIFVLLFSEILPKTLGSAYWKQLSNVTAYLIHFITLALIFIVAPIEIFKKMLPGAKQSTVTRDEFAVLADIGEEEGEIEKDEEEVIKNLLRLRDIEVELIMTPRVVISSVDKKESVSEVMGRIPIMTHGRMPVIDDDIDKVSGYVLRSEILRRAAVDDFNSTMEDLSIEVHKCKHDDSVDRALDILLENKEQVLIVQDDFGGTVGLVTMEDVIETLLGVEIVDESDEVEDMRELAKQLNSDSSIN
ncbi:MAG: hemolysin [Euryarchaeota archaeon]|nr:hemolysin [Euryarchaeota archaeon]|tara:strand:+ start:1393 stop:2364 length:972 start_codon:yes stop_codon:yes gene_type:complete